MFSPFLVPLFAFLYRCRGGFLGTGHTQVARFVYWAAPIAIFASTINVYVGWLCGVMAFLSLLGPLGNASYQNGPSLKNALIGSAVGVTRLVMVLAPLAVFQHCVAFLCLFGLLVGPAYYFAEKYMDGIDSHISFPGLTLFGKTIIQPGKFATGGSEWAEVLTGAINGLAFAVLSF